jgi:hypothetical protein
VRQSTGRGFFDDGRQAATAFARQNQGSSPHSDRRTGDGTQIPRILDGRTHKNHRLFATGDLRQKRFAQFVPFHELAHVANRDHTLVTTPARANSQFTGLQLLAGNSGVFGHLLQGVEPPISGAPLEQKTLDALGFGLEKRFDGMLSANHLGRILGLRTRREPRTRRARRRPAIKRRTPRNRLFVSLPRGPRGADSLEFPGIGWICPGTATGIGTTRLESPRSAAVQERTCTAERDRTASTNWRKRYSESWGPGEASGWY